MCIRDRKKAWQPTVIQGAPGVFTADPHALWEDGARTLGKFWGARLEPPEAWIPDRQCFPRASIEDLRKGIFELQPPHST
eukprot:7789767-Pyramimonas_sp.AAC.1